MDTTISDNPDAQEGEPSDQSLAKAEFPVSLETLSVDGTNPSVGDEVEVKVKASVVRVTNDIAWVKPSEINGQPMPSEPISPNPALDERSRLKDLSAKADQAGGFGY